MPPKINRETLAGQAAGRLLEYIETQQLKPADILPSESSLAERFGVSRPVIREALKNLVDRGVVEIVNGKGTIIKPIDSDPLRLFFQRATRMDQSAIVELMEVRRGLEAQSAALAAVRRTPQDIEAIQDLLRAMENSTGNFEDYTTLDMELHLSIAAASRNTMLGYLIGSIRDALRGSIAAGLRGFAQRRTDEPYMRNVQNAHEQILQALIASSPTEAMQAMLQHFDLAATAIDDGSTQLPAV